jgi:hypothetical protein
MMVRNAYTWIELIFVIVIVGILAAVVTSKMGQMADRANKVQLLAFTGTLNRSVGSNLWGRSIDDGNGGSIALVQYENELQNYVEILPGYSTGPSLTLCNSAGTGVFLTYPKYVIFEIHCRDGNLTSSPNFRLYDTDAESYVE